MQRGGGSKHTGLGRLRKVIWNIKVPNVVKMLLESVPTKENFLKKGIVTDSLCPICGLERENVEHILWSYPSTRDVWGACGKVQKSSGGEFAFINVMEETMDISYM
jgi:hypothetical protein